MGALAWERVQSPPLETREATRVSTPDAAEPTGPALAQGEMTFEIRSRMLDFPIVLPALGWEPDTA